MKRYFTHLSQIFTKVLLLTNLFFFSVQFTQAQVTFEKEVKISDGGLFFDGVKVPQGTPNNGPRYDYIFGNRITPHGDCIKEYDGYIFMTWYKGGKNNRQVMLSRYNPNTDVVKTIQFPHRHNGFQNTPHLGESHNTIALGLCPIDGTIHMVYDLHSYSENRPANGSLANDYFRYTFSKKNVITVSDDQFTLNQFVEDNPGDYKHLSMRSGTNYKSLTYPNFFLNKEGELFMWIREGGNNNGAYKFCKYDGTSWTGFTQFNVLNARSRPAINYNWGLYGDIKFESGKMRIGFHIRSNNNNDKYELNSGFYYGYSDDPNGLNQWKDHEGNGFSLPLIDPDRIKVSEPGNVVNASGANSVRISRGADWTVTDRGDIHFVSEVSGGGQRRNVHTYKRAGTNNFVTSTSFPGGNLYTYNNEVYLIGLENGRIFVEKADGGTNNWTRIYNATSGKNFRHGNVYIANGKIYFYLMERESGSSQPLYLQILDLGLDISDENSAPTVNITSPADGTVFELGENISLTASAVDVDGNLERVNFKIDDAFYRSDDTRPFESTFTPTDAGTYKIAARAVDREGASTEVFVNITVEAPNVAPEVELISPLNGAIYEVGEEIVLLAEAQDTDGSVAKVNFKVNGAFYRLLASPPYRNTFQTDEPGTYVIGVRAFDNLDASTEESVTIEIRTVTSNQEFYNEESFNVFPNPNETGVFNLSNATEWTVLSVQGQKILKGNGQQIDLSKMNKGIYIVHLPNGVLKRIVVK